jgi:hypothetical protein
MAHFYSNHSRTTTHKSHVQKDLGKRSFVPYETKLRMVNGHPPVKLEDLVPGELASIPSPGGAFGDSGNYRYEARGSSGFCMNIFINNGTVPGYAFIYNGKWDYADPCFQAHLKARIDGWVLLRQ